MADFIYKGHEITITDGGTFRYIGGDGKAVSKPSLKAAKAAIDKTVGTVLVPAMKANGVKVDIASRDRHGAYITTTGERIGQYSGLYRWDDEVAAKISEVGERQEAETKRHNEARHKLESERGRYMTELPRFDYDGALAEVMKQEPS